MARSCDHLPIRSGVPVRRLTHDSPTLGRGAVARSDEAQNANHVTGDASARVHVPEVWTGRRVCKAGATHR